MTRTATELRISEIDRRLETALERRRGLELETEAMRIVHAEADGLPGLVIERFASALLVRYREAAWKRELPELLEILPRRIRGTTSIFVQRESREGDAREVPRLLAGEAPADDFSVREGDFRYRIILGRGTSTGLFLDMRDQRDDCGPLCRGRSVLNLFCYTGAFTVVAAGFGASELTSIDISRVHLEVARENMRINGLEERTSRWIRDDVMSVLARWCRSSRRFGWIFCDPPTFGRAGRKSPFSAIRDYPGLAEAVWSLLDEDGMVLFACNARRMSRSTFAQLLTDAAARAGRRVEIEDRTLRIPRDFPTVGSQPVYPLVFLGRTSPLHC